MPKAAPGTCPCGRPTSYEACCGQYHQGAAAPDAESLMRSRYTAYALGLSDYLLATWHASTRPATLDFADAPRWLGLRIVSLPQSPASAHLQKKPGNAALDVNAIDERSQPLWQVEFVARYKVGGRAFRLHETSRFTREDGRWYYIDGDLHE